MNTAQRLQSMEKRQTRYTPLPKYWQPKQPASVQLTCQVIHHDKIEDFRLGRATVELMWDWVADHLTYAEMVRLLKAEHFEVSDEAAEAIAEEGTIIDEVIDRYIRTGRVGFSGPQLLIARAAAFAHDLVIELDRHGIAGKARVHSDHATEQKKMTIARRMLEQMQTTTQWSK